MRGSGSSRRYCFKRQATSWTLLSGGMEGLPESKVAWGGGGKWSKILMVRVRLVLGWVGRGRRVTFKAFCLVTEPAFLKMPSLAE